MADIWEELSRSCVDDEEQESITELPVCTACNAVDIFIFIVCSQCKQTNICYECYTISQIDISEIGCPKCENPIIFMYSERLQSVMEENVNLACGFCGEKIQLSEMAAHVQICTSSSATPEKKKCVLDEFRNIEEHKKQCLEDLEILTADVVDDELLLIKDSTSVVEDIGESESDYYDKSQYEDPVFMPVIPNNNLERQRIYGGKQNCLLKNIRLMQRLRKHGDPIDVSNSKWIK